MDYIPSRSLMEPLPAGRPIRLSAISYWFQGVTRVDFHAGTTLIATATEPTGSPNGEAYEATWESPDAGIHPVYAILHNDKGGRCITKPCPLVVE